MLEQLISLTFSFLFCFSHFLRCVFLLWNCIFVFKISKQITHWSLLQIRKPSKAFKKTKPHRNIFLILCNYVSLNMFFCLFLLLFYAKGSKEKPLVFHSKVKSSGYTSAPRYCILQEHCARKFNKNHLDCPNRENEVILF